MNNKAAWMSMNRLRGWLPVLLAGMIVVVAGGARADENYCPLPIVTISTTAQTVTETSGIVNVPVTLSCNPLYQVTVNLVVTGTAAAGSDYVTTSPSPLVFYPNNTLVRYVPIHILNDVLDEDDEVVTVTITSASNASLGSPPVGSVLIQDNDAPPNATVELPQIFENQGQALVPVRLDKPSGKTISLDYFTSATEVAPQYAIAGEDYITTSGVLTFAPGETEKFIPITILDDTGHEVFEGAEAFSLRVTENLSGASRVTINDGPDFTLEILDNESEPQVIPVASVVTWEETTPTISIPIKLTVPSSEPQTLGVTFGGTATRNVDYTVSADTLSFGVEEVSASLSFTILADDVHDPYETILVYVGGKLIAKIVIVNGDDLASLRIEPAEQLVLGSGQQARFHVRGYNGRGEEVTADPVWGRSGPGSITQTGFYIAPLEAAQDAVTIYASQKGVPEIRAEKLVRLDTLAPKMVGISLTGTTSATLTWELDSQSLELSQPIVYTILLDEITEIGRVTSADVHNSLSFGTQAFPNGPHTIRIQAEDSVGNRSGAEDHKIDFVINNTLDESANPSRALSWLLVHQSRNKDDFHGSWKNGWDRSRAELVVETAISAVTLATADYRFNAYDPNLDDGTKVSVARAYHDAVIWLGRQWKAGQVVDFVDKTVVTEALAQASKRRERLVDVLGSVDREFDEAVAISAAFAADQGLEGGQNGEGWYAKGEESLGSRFETIAAIKAAVASGDRERLQSILEKSRTNLDPKAKFLAPAAGGGWSNTYRLDDSQVNAYLASEICSALVGSSGSALAQDMKTLLTDTFNYLKTLQAGSGGFPSEATPADTAAVLHAFGMGKLAEVGVADDVMVIEPARDYLLGYASFTETGSWNSRAVDTALAVRALRPELTVTVEEGSAGYDFEHQQVKFTLKNRGAYKAENVRVSAYFEDPATLRPSQRASKAIGSALVSLIDLSETKEGVIKINQTETPNRLYLMVDPEERIAEYSDDNNQAFWKLPQLPNLALHASEIRVKGLSGTLPPVAGSTWTLTTRVHNYGLTPIPVNNSILKVKLYEGNPLTDARAVYIRYETLQEQPGREGREYLGAGEWIDVDIEIVPERYDMQTPGPRNLYVWVDPDSGLGRSRGEFAESVETDNVAGRTIEVYEPGTGALPNLKIVPEAIVTQPDPLNPDEVSRVRVRVDNVGPGSADGFDVGVAFDDLGTSQPVRVGNLAPGRSTVVFVPMVAKANGATMIRALADTTNLIRESDESDNFVSVLVSSLRSDSGLDVAINPANLNLERGTTPFTAKSYVQNLGATITEPYDMPVIYELFDGEESLADIELGSVTPISGLTGTDTPSPENLDHGSSVPSQMAFTALNGETYPKVTLRARAELKDGDDPISDIPGNNSAVRQFSVEKTNLKAFSLTASPSPVRITQSGQALGSLTLQAQLGNGEIGEDYVQAEHVHVEIRDAVTSRVLAYWHDLTIQTPSSEADNPQSTVTLTLPDVMLPPGTYHLQVEVDPNGYFVETNEKDNIADLYLTVTDEVEGRPAPDLAYPSAPAIGLKEINGKLYVRVTASNQTETPSLCAPSASSSLKLYQSATLDNSTSSALAGLGVTIPALAAGESYTVLVPTGLIWDPQTPQNTYLWTLLDALLLVDERDEDNNTTAALLASPAVTEASALAIFDTVQVQWEPVPGASAYRVARYEVGNPAILAQVVLGGSEIRWEDQAGLEPGHDYKYKVWARSENGLWSLPVETNSVEIGKVPTITSISYTDQSGIQTLDTTPSATPPSSEIVTVSATGEEVTLVTSYEAGATLELLNNYEPVTTAEVQEDGTATFNDVVLTDFFNELRVSCVQTAGGKSYSALSNRVIVYYDIPQPDLTFALNSEQRPDVSIIASSTSGGSGDSVNSSSDGEELKDKYLSITANIVDKEDEDGDEVPVAPFWVHFLVKLEDGTTLTNTVKVGSGEAAVFPATATWELTQATTGGLERVEVRLDSKGPGDPGEIAEKVETNNYYAVSMQNGKDSVGKEYIVPSLYAADYEMDVYGSYKNLAAYPSGEIDSTTSLNLTRFLDGIHKLQTGEMDELVPFNDMGPSIPSFLFPLPMDYVRLAGHTGLSPSYEPYLTFSDHLYNFSRMLLNDGDLLFNGNYPDFIIDNNLLKINSLKSFGLNYFIQNAATLNESSMVYPAKQLGTKYYLSSFGCSYNDNPGAYFQIFPADNINEDDITTVIIKQNKFMVPDFSNPNWHSPAVESKITDNVNKSYKIGLRFGETYLWRSASSNSPGLNEASGVIIESENGKRIGVVSGSVGQIPYFNTTGYYWSGVPSYEMVPPVDLLGNQYILVPPPLSGEEYLPNSLLVGDFDWSKDSDGNSLEGNRILNYIHRIIATADNTEILVKPENTIYHLDEGDILDIGANSLPYATVDLGSAGNSKYIALRDGVKRLIDSQITTHVVTANNRIMVNTFLCATKISEYGSFSLPDWGGSSMFINQPVSKFSNETKISICLQKEYFNKDWISEHDRHFNYVYPSPAPWEPPPTHTYETSPTQLLTIIAKHVGVQDPDILIGESFDSPTTSILNQVLEYPRTSYNWDTILVNNTPTGFKVCTVELPAYSSFYGRDIHQYVINNPDKIPISIQQFGMMPYSSYSQSAGVWESNSLSGDQFPIDLEVTASGIRFPKSKKLIPNVAAPLRLEILNNGTDDVVTADGATISLWEQLRQTDGSVTEEPLSGWTDVAIPATGAGDILRKRLAPHIIEFNLNPKANLVGIRARISMIGDGDPTNNEALFVVPPGMIRPDFGVRAPMPASWPATMGDNIKVTATVTLKDIHVEEVPLTWTYGFTGAEQTTTVLVRFLPNSTETTSPRYQAATTVTLTLPHPGYGGLYTITARVNADNAIAEQTVNADVNQQSVQHTFAPGNLAVSATAPATAVAGEQVPVECVVTNSSGVTYTNVRVQIRLNSGPVVFRQVIPVVGPESSVTVPAALRLYGPGEVTLKTELIVPEDQVETSQADNEDTDIVRVFDSGKADLAFANAPNTLAKQPEGATALPVTVSRGDAVELEGKIINLGPAPVTVPYKYQVFDGGMSFSRGEVIAEAIVDCYTTSPQITDQIKTQLSQWLTAEAEPGEHSLTAVIDSADHLAGAGGAELQKVARVPMLGSRLTSSGIRLVSASKALEGSSWTLELYATDRSVTTSGQLLGSFREGSGFSPGLYQGETTNVQVQLKSLTGESLPVFQEPVQFQLSFIEAGDTTGTERASTLNINLPANSQSGYGTGAGFWLADDGSVYFTQRMHLAGSFGALGQEDMSAFEAMTDMTGLVDEDNEFNNIYTQMVIIREEDHPNLVVSAIRPLPSPQSPGRVMGVDVDITNTAASCAEPVEVALDVSPIAGSDPATTIGVNRIILGPMAHGNTVTRRFDWETGNPGDYHFHAEADPLGKVVEVSDDDNGLTVTASVSASTTMTFTAALASSYDYDEQVPAELQVHSSEINTWGMLSLHVLKALTGESADQIDVSREVPFPLEGTTDFEKSWNNGVPGDYRFEARLKQHDENGERAGELRAQSEIFTVDPHKVLTTFIQTERPVYVTGESVQFVAGVRSDTLGYTYPELSVQVEILSEEFETEVLSVSPIINLLPGELRLAQGLTWTVPDTLPDVPVVTARLKVWEPAHPEVLYGPVTTQFAIRNGKPILVIDEPTSGSYHNKPVRVTWSSPSPVDVRTSEGMASAFPFRGTLSVVSGFLESGDHVSSEGIILVDASATGYFGQDTVTTSVLFYVDRTSPTLSNTGYTPSYSGGTQVNISGDADDGDGSGIAAVEVLPEGSGTWQSVASHWYSGNETYPTRHSFTHSIYTNEPTYSYSLRTTDLAGNVSAITTHTAVMDVEAPQITPLAPVGTTVTQSSFILRVQVTDDFSGIAAGSVKYKVNALGLEDGWKAMTQVSGNAMSAVFEATVTSATRYSDSNAQFEVKASDNVGHNQDTSLTDANPAVWSNWIDFDIPPQIPTGLRAYYSDSNEVSLEWNSNTEPDFATYRVKREVTTGTPSVQYFHGILNDTQSRSNWTTDSTVSVNTARHYKYSMLAIDVAGNESEWCQAVPVLPPGRPEGLKAIGSSSMVRLSFNRVTEGFVDEYRVYRGATLENKPSYTLLTTIDAASLLPGIESIQTTDTTVSANQTYFYYVVAVDKAGNKSFESDSVRAETQATPNMISLCRVTFEDITRDYLNLWDFNDVGVAMYARAELTPQDNVSTITVMAVGALHYQSGFEHDLYMSFFKLHGTANWQGVRFDRDDLVTQAHPVFFGPGVYTDSNSSIPLFMRSHKSVEASTYDFSTTETRGINGDWCALFITLNNPSANPISGFEMVPFDTFIEVHPGPDNPVVTHSVGVYDPLRPETQNKYFKNYTRISNWANNDPLQDLEIPSGLTVPFPDWQPPEEYQVLWKNGQYPYFQRYAPTLNSLLIKYRNWYEFHTLSDF